MDICLFCGGGFIPSCPEVSRPGGYRRSGRNSFPRAKRRPIFRPAIVIFGLHLECPIGTWRSRGSVSSTHPRSHLRLVGQLKVPHVLVATDGSADDETLSPQRQAPHDCLLYLFDGQSTYAREPLFYNSTRGSHRFDHPFRLCTKHLGVPSRCIHNFPAQCRVSQDFNIQMLGTATHLSEPHTTRAFRLSDFTPTSESIRTTCPKFAPTQIGYVLSGAVR